MPRKRPGNRQLILVPEFSDGNHPSNTHLITQRGKMTSKIPKKRKATTPPSSASDASEYDLSASSSLESDDSESEQESGEPSESDEGSTTTAVHKKKKRKHDPAVFSTTMSKILASHLTTKARHDPVLVRAKRVATGVDESKLEAKARRVLREERRAEMELGRVKDLAADEEGVALERRLRKTAQRGVVKLFNAVRAAQVVGEAVGKEVKQKGIVGMGKREEKGMFMMLNVQDCACSTAANECPAVSHRNVEARLPELDTIFRKLKIKIVPRSLLLYQLDLSPKCNSAMV